MLTLMSTRRAALPVIRRILSAAASNDALEELHLDSNIPVSHHVDAFCHFMQQTKSIRRLKADSSSNSALESQERVAAALGSNRTLECLTFDTGSLTFTESFLSKLSTHPFLKKLQIASNFLDTTTNLSPLLQSNVSQLCDLGMKFFKFDNRAMDGLVLGLRDNETLEKLSLSLCKLDDEATKQFLQFFGKNECNVRDLALHHIQFDTQKTGDVVLDLLRHNQSLVKVTYYSHYDTSFFIQFASIAANVRLDHLALTYHVKRAHWTVLGGQILPNTRLRELTLGAFPDHPETATAFLEGLRRNGSLHKVHVSEINSFSTADTRRMEAYLARNRYVAQCWAPSNAERSDEIRRLIYPRVTLAVQPIKNLSPNMILTGLLAMGNDGIGPQHHTLSGNVRLL